MLALPAKSEVSLKILDHEGFLALREGATVLEADFYGEKVLALADGRILKLFRRKRLITSAAWYPYAQRFADNCQGLAKRGIPCPEVLEVYRVPSISRDAVLYSPLAGKTIRQLIEAGLSESEANSLRHSIRGFVSFLHGKGVFFRSLHLGNIVKTPVGTLGLIDVADMIIRSKPLSRFSRYRNKKHLLRNSVDAKWLETNSPI